MKLPTTLLVPFLVLSACGGGNSAVVQYSDLLSEGLEVLGELSSEPRTADSNLPTGSATYNGVALIDYDDFSSFGSGERFLGDAKATVDFDSGEIVATADNFYQIVTPNFVDSEGEAVSGSVSMTLNETADGVNDFLGTATGSITNLEGEVISLDMEVDADFEAENGAHLDIDGFNSAATTETELTIQARSE